MAVVNPTYNVTNVKRAVVLPLKPIPHKPVAPLHEPLSPGGAKTPGASGGNRAPDAEPALLKPADKEANISGSDRDGNSPLSSEEKVFDLWCPANVVLTKRAPGDSTRRCLARRTNRERRRVEILLYIACQQR